MSTVSNKASRHTPYDDSYPSCERTYAELRIYSGFMDPETVTNQLGVAPTSLQKKGERRVNSLGRTREVILNGWFLSSESEVSSRDLRQHLDWLLDKIEPSAPQLSNLQTAAGLTMLVNCIWWSAKGQGGPTLWPEQMQRVSALDLECSFDIAFFGTDE